MKMKSKYKWALVGLAFIISLVGMVLSPTLGFMPGFPLTILSFILFLASAGYSVAGMLEANIFERFFEWLNSDDL